MSIGITYGPISAGLQAAVGSGIAQRNRTRSQDDLQFLGLMNQAQAHADQQYANQVQQALGVNEFNADQNLQQQHLATQQAMANRDFQFRVYDQNRDAALRQQAISQQGQLGQARLGVQNDRLDLANTKYSNQQNALQQLPPELQNVVGATGRMPYVPNSVMQPDRTAQTLTAIGRRLDAEIGQEQKNSSNFTLGKNDLTSQKSSEIPGVISGMEQKYTASQKRIQSLTEQRQQVDDALKAQTQSILQPGAKVNPVQQYLQTLNSGHGQQQPDKSGGAGQDAGDQNSGGIQTAPDGTPIVKTAQDYAQLPSGTVYINGNSGQKARKP